MSSRARAHARWKTRSVVCVKNFLRRDPDTIAAIGGDHRPGSPAGEDRAAAWPGSRAIGAPGLRATFTAASAKVSGLKAPADLTGVRVPTAQGGGGAHPAPEAGGRNAPTEAERPAAAAGRRATTRAEAPREGAATGGTGAGRAAATAPAARPEPPEASPGTRARYTATPRSTTGSTQSSPPAGRAQTTAPRQEQATKAEQRTRPRTERTPTTGREPTTGGRYSSTGLRWGRYSSTGRSWRIADSGNKRSKLEDRQQEAGGLATSGYSRGSERRPPGAQRADGGRSGCASLFAALPPLSRCGVVGR